MEQLVYKALDLLVEVLKVVHFPAMFIALVGGISLRFLVFHTVKRHAWFGRQFERRVSRFLSGEMSQKRENVSFYVISKRLLENTFYEAFEKRDHALKDKPDQMMPMADRVFLVKMGCAWFVHDLLKQIRFLRYGDQPPKLMAITKNTLGKNPAFNRVLGVVPSVTVNDILNVLPGLFVIGGIFGTFLGVMKGLPELSHMDLDNPEKTKAIMDRFLFDISISMGASITGILFSVIMTIVNTVFSPERVFVEFVDRMENCLDLLWNYAHSNEVPSGLKPFDENADPVEALAAAALSQELESSRSKKGVGEQKSA